MFPAAFIGHGIQCYQCESRKSWNECVPGNNTECATRLDSCVKFEGRVEFQGETHEYVNKGCALKSRCNDEACEILEKVYSLYNIKIKKCDVSCCQSDLCNGAKVPIVSGFLFLACAYVAFFS